MIPFRDIYIKSFEESVARQTGVLAYVGLL
jgi:hypothetical protein